MASLQCKNLGLLRDAGAPTGVPYLCSMEVIAQLAAALAGRYTIEKELGAGGMATVYLAQDAAASSGRRTLVTTRRLKRVSSARKTRDMPPPPSSRSIA